MSMRARIAPLRASPAVREAVLEFAKAELEDAKDRLMYEADPTRLRQIQGRAHLLAQMVTELTT